MNQPQTKTQVMFIVFSETVAPETITKLFAISPDEVVRKGEPVMAGAKQMARNHRWILSTGKPSDKTLEQLIDDLLRRTSRLGNIGKRIPHSRTKLACIVYTNQYDYATSIAPAKLVRLAEMGVEVYFEIHAPRNVAKAQNPTRRTT